MKQIERDILKTFKTFWGTWAKREFGKDTLDKILPFLDENISAFGTGEHEFGNSFDNVKYNFECDFTEFKNPLTINYLYENVRLLSDTVGHVEAETHVEFFDDNKNHFKLFLRFTNILVFKNNKWLISHIHLSIPSEDQGDGEAFPLDALQARNNRLTALVEQRTKELEEKTVLLEKEKDKTEKLLFNILPKKIAKELLDNGYSVPVRHENVSVIFTDFVEFTKIASEISPRELVEELNEIFFHFDSLIKEQELEKIKTIGDSYMAVCGLPEPHNEHAFRCIVVARKMLHFIEDRNSKRAIKWQMRIGIHSGPVVAGIVGNDKFAYDLWGSTVNLASRLEGSGLQGRINISEDTYRLIKESIPCEYRGKQIIKGNREVDMYFVN